MHNATTNGYLQWRTRPNLAPPTKASWGEGCAVLRVWMQCSQQAQALGLLPINADIARALPVCLSLWLTVLLSRKLRLLSSNRDHGTLQMLGSQVSISGRHGQHSVAHEFLSGLQRHSTSKQSACKKFYAIACSSCPLCRPLLTPKRSLCRAIHSFLSDCFQLIPAPCRL